MIKGVTHTHIGPFWYHSEPSNVPYCPNQLLALNFFAVSYSKTAQVFIVKKIRKIQMILDVESSEETVIHRIHQNLITKLVILLLLLKLLFLMKMQHQINF